MNPTPVCRLPAAARFLPLLLLLVWAIPGTGHAFTHTVSGGAITFSDSASGGGGYVSFPHNAVMNTGTTFTAEAWVAAPAACDLVVFLRYKAYKEHKQLGVSSNGSVYFVYAGSPWGSPGGYITTVENIFPFDGQFHHVAFVRHSAGTYQVFIDGIEKMNAGPGPYWPLNSGIINSDSLTQIGDASVEASIDELRISSIDRYNANFTPAPRWESDASTVMLLHFDEGSGTTIHDSSSYGQTGTVTGGTIQWTPAFVLAGPVTNPANGHLYYLLDKDNWTNSEAHAVALGGHLVTINDAAENDWVFNTFNGCNGGDLHLWIGLYDPVSGDGSGTTHRNNFAWINGTPVSYMNWETGEPNNNGGREQYGMMYNRDSLFPGLWNDAPLDLSGWPDNQSIYGVVEVVPPAENQAITFSALPAKTYGDADFAPGAVASSGLAVTYTSSNSAVATIVDGNIHIVGAGTTTITAAQSGNENWNAASSMTQTLTVAQKALTATAENKTRSFGAANPALSLAYTGLVVGDTVAGLDMPPMAACSATATSGVGTYPITVSGGSDNNYAFSYVAGTLTITPAVPTVTTTAPVAIGTTTVTSGGTVTSDGGASVTVRGVCWSITANPTVANAKTGNGVGPGAFSSTLAKLSAGTTYYVRAYATNSAGTGYGAPQSVTTPVAKGADFVITDIIITPELPAVGGKFTATITVLNQGILSGKAGTLYVWLDKPGTAGVGEKGDKSASISTLKPGQSKAVRVSLTAPKTWGTFILRAFVDAKNGVKEDDEYNNQETYDYATGLPDFEILDVWISPEIPVVGKTFTAYVTVTNSGEVAGNAGTLDLWADTSYMDGLPVPGAKIKGNKYKTLGVLQPGQEKVITVTGLKAAADNEWPVLGLLIDSRAKTLELDEDNNWAEYGYECQ